MTRRPDLFAAVMGLSGIYDVIEAESTVAGNFYSSEYGTRNDPKQFKEMLSYSPYHNVKKGIQYPATWILTGENDRRVDPMHAYKMVAVLQGSGSKKPIFLSVGINEGHNYFPTVLDETAFFFAQLNVKYVKPKK